MTGPGHDEEEEDEYGMRCLDCGELVGVIDVHAPWRKPLGRDTYELCDRCAEVRVHRASAELWNASAGQAT